MHNCISEYPSHTNLENHSSSPPSEQLILLEHLKPSGRLMEMRDELRHRNDSKLDSQQSPCFHNQHQISCTLRTGRDFLRNNSHHRLRDVRTKHNRRRLSHSSLRYQNTSQWDLQISMDYQLVQLKWKVLRTLLGWSLEHFRHKSHRHKRNMQLKRYYLQHLHLKDHRQTWRIEYQFHRNNRHRDHCSPDCRTMHNCIRGHSSHTNLGSRSSSPPSGVRKQFLWACPKEFSADFHRHRNSMLDLQRNPN
mmetsp:Transcript_9316/g.13812  ORF Transcript_9316/g.13812 Transcript_9316/m.13812 type:complete len:249 (+) Transcript_9316:70-816(+)